MALSSKHPLYGVYAPDWFLMAVTYAGERAVKDAGPVYLPPTGAMIKDGMNVNGVGWLDYEAYKMRSIFHEIVQPSVDAMLGVMHRKPPTIELPDVMWEKGGDAKNQISVVRSFNGEDLDCVLQNINRDQLRYGRLGLLVDVATGAKAGEAPYLLSYTPQTMWNWDATKPFQETGIRKTQFVVLDESSNQRKGGLQWEYQRRYRVLADLSVVDPSIFPGIENALPAGAGTYVAGEAVNREDEAGLQWVRPSLAGNGLLTLPFIFINAVDLVPEPSKPPLLGLAKLAMAIYRGEADYRDSLFKTGQATLVTIGQSNQDPNEMRRIGSNAEIKLPLQGDAKYISAGSDCLEPMASSIQRDLERAAQLGASLLDQKGNAAESGDALQIRSAARTTTLTNIAKAGAYGLELALKQAAVFMGADPTKVKVTPNLEFESDVAVALDAVNLMTAKNMGFPLSTRSLHGWAARNDFTSLSYDEEQAELADEPPPVALGTPGVAGLPPGPGQKPGATPQGGKPPAPGAKPAPGAAKAKPGAPAVNVTIHNGFPPKAK